MCCQNLWWYLGPENAKLPPASVHALSAHVSKRSSALQPVVVKRRAGGRSTLLQEAESAPIRAAALSTAVVPCLYKQQRLWLIRSRVCHLDLFEIGAGKSLRAWQHASTRLGFGAALPCQAVGAAVGAGGGQGKMSGRSCRGLLGQGGREDGGQEAGAAARAGGRQRPRLLLADFQKREKSS